MILADRARRSSSAVVFIEQGQRRIPVQYAKRVVGRKMTSGGSTYIPLKVNQAGVIPIIFASSVLYFPAARERVSTRTWFTELREQLLHEPAEPRLHAHRSACWSSSSRTSTRRSRSTRSTPPTTSASTAGSSRHPAGTADRRVPELRPHADHAARLDVPRRDRADPADRLARLDTIQQFPFGGTSLLITVGVALETMKQLESQLLMRHYEGFLS